LIRNKRYWNSSNLSPKDPVVANLCSQNDIKNATDKADKKAARKKKEMEKQNKKLESDNQLDQNWWKLNSIVWLELSWEVNLTGKPCFTAAIH